MTISGATLWLLLFCGVSALGGCAIVVAEADDGTEAIALRPLSADSGEARAVAPRWVRTTSFGASSTPLGLSFGLSRSEIVAAPADCRAFVVLHSDATAAARDLVKRADEKCVFQNN